MRTTVKRSDLDNPEAQAGDVTMAPVSGAEQAVKIIEISGDRVVVDTDLDAPEYGTSGEE